MLGRRELSEEQVRERLERHGHATHAVEDAIDRLKRDGAIDDLRTAHAIARRETAVKKRGRFRVRLEIERAGIAAETACRVVDEIFESIDDDVLMEGVLLKRLRGRDGIASQQEFRRLFRYLVSEGFDADQVLRALRARQQTPV
jgi:regulatory protein